MEIFIDLTNEQAEKLRPLAQMEDSEKGTVVLGRLGMQGKRVQFNHMAADITATMHAVSAPAEYMERYFSIGDLPDPRTLLNEARERIDNAVMEDVKAALL